MRIYRVLFVAVLSVCGALWGAAQEPFALVGDTVAGGQLSRPGDIRFQVGVVAGVGDDELAPYYLSSNNGGVTTQQYSALVAAGVSRGVDRSKRLSWGAGMELWGGYASSAAYERYEADADQWSVMDCHPARVWIQQAYVEGKYRSIFAMAGGRYKHSPIVNESLSSGDMTWSVNARPPMGLTGGFIDYQDVPFTHGWLQLNGEFGNYREVDDKWLENHYNYYNNFITTHKWLHYKSLHFRTNPARPLVFTIGAQSACQFGGTARYYEHGQVTRTVKMDADAKAFWRTFIAGSGGNSAGDSFVEGNHLGTWDVLLECKLPGGAMLRGYCQSPWEDGSGIGKLNGFDGLWGLEYRAGGKSVVTGAVVEYVELTNHSGPLHWSKDDNPESPIRGHATGADDYYNNYIYNGYQSRGMSIGSPFVKSPLYNRDGYMRYRDNVTRGFHAALTGCIGGEWNYRLMASYRKAWGTPIVPRAHAVDDFSMMLEVRRGIVVAGRRGLEVAGAVAIDRGSLYGDNMGAKVGITYRGNFNPNKQ